MKDFFINIDEEDDKKVPSAEIPERRHIDWFF
jgi:hypothetical protein